MLYTRLMFGHDLKERVLKKQDITEIGIWAHSVYLECCGHLDVGLLQVMLDLNTMEIGPEFSISYRMLDKIADDLISGKTVDLNSDEYRETAP